MNRQAPEPDPLSPDADCRGVDRLLEAFEAELKAGLRPSIEAYLLRLDHGLAEMAGDVTLDATVVDRRRADVLRQLLQLEIWYARRDGREPAREEYLARFPDAAPILHEVCEGSVAGTGVETIPQEYAAARHPGEGAAQAGPRFRVLRPHARGGLGEVYVARDQELHRDVALKQIQEKFADSPQNRARFLQEAEITGGLEHPGIVPIYSLGHDGRGRPYYAMRLIKGESLKDLIQRLHRGVATSELTEKGPTQGSPTETNDLETAKTSNEVREGFDWTDRDQVLELRRLLGRYVDVCNAVEYAHSRGVIHRDLKPANIMVGKYGETLIVDWGLAKSVGRSGEAVANDEATLIPVSGSGSDQTRAGTALGTPQYMSPEQAAGQLDELGPATDIYSLGATLYNVLTGRSPFPDNDRAVVVQKVRKGEFARPRELDRRISRALEAVCLKAMALFPMDRYQSARSLADDIERWLADERLSVYRERLVERLGRSGRRHRGWTAAAATALVLITGVLIAAAVLTRNQTIALEKVRDEQRNQLHESLYQQGRALWLAREPGWREKSLSAIREAATIKSDQRLRDLAVQTLVSSDRQLIRAIDLSGDASHLVVSPDGKEFAAAVGANVDIREMATGKRKTVFEHARADITSLVYGPNGKQLAATDAGGTILVWDPRRKRLVRAIKPTPNEPPMAAIAFGPFARCVATSNGESMRIWEVSAHNLKIRWEGKIIEESAMPPAPDMDTSASTPIKPQLHPGQHPTARAASWRRPHDGADVDPVAMQPEGADPASMEPRAGDVAIAADIDRSFVVVAGAGFTPMRFTFENGACEGPRSLDLPWGTNVHLALSGDGRYLFMACNDPAPSAEPVGTEGLNNALASKPDAVPLAPGIAVEPGQQGAGTLDQRELSEQPLDVAEQPETPEQPVVTADPGETPLQPPTPGGRAPFVHSPAPPAASFPETPTPTSPLFAGFGEIQVAPPGMALTAEGLLPAARIQTYDLWNDQRYQTYDAVEAPPGDVRGLLYDSPTGHLLLASASGVIVDYRFAPPELGTRDGGSKSGTQVIVDYRFLPPELAVAGVWESPERDLRTVGSGPHVRTILTAGAREPVRQWRMHGSRFSTSLRAPSPTDGHRRHHPVAFSMAGHRFAVAVWGDRVEVRDATRDRLITTIPDRFGSNLAWTPRDDRIVLVSAPDELSSDKELSTCLKSVTLMVDSSADEGREVTQIDDHDAGCQVGDMALSPNGRWCVTSGRHQGLSGWKQSRSGLTRFRELSKQKVYGRVAFDRRSRRLAAVRMPGTIELWSTQTWRRSQTLTEPGDEPARVFVLSFSPDDRFLAAGTASGKLLVWDLKTSSRPSVLEGAAAIYAIDYSSDGKLLATGHHDGRLSLWEPSANRLVASWAAHSSSVGQVAFVSDGEALISSGNNGAVVRWNLAAIRAGLKDLGLDW